MKKYFHSLLLTFAVAFVFISFTNAQTTNPDLTNLHVVSKTSNTVIFDWDDCGCASKTYTVKYVRVSDGYESQEFYTGNSNFTFGNLPAGTYKFFFKVDCGGGSSGFIGADDLMEM